MQVIQPYVEVPKIDGVAMMKAIERAGRTCYRSEEKIGETTYAPFIERVIANGHHSVLEHEKVTVRFIVDRGVSHEIVRHRIASFSQESTRFCNYSNGKFGNEITVIEPFFFNNPISDHLMATWDNGCNWAEQYYLSLLKDGATPQEARSVLPNSLKTEIVMTANLREWRLFFELRAAKPAHPQLRQVAIPLLLWFKEQLPTVFNDIKYDFNFDPKNHAEIKEVVG